MLKNIVIIGSKGVGKTTLFRKLISYYKMNSNEKFHCKFSPIVNYVESLINIEDIKCRLIDTPPLILFPKSEVEKKIKEQLEQLFADNSLIFWIIDHVDEQAILFSKFLNKKKTKHFLLLNKIDLLDIDSCPWKILKPEHFFLISAKLSTNIEQLIIATKNYLLTNIFVSDNNLSTNINDNDDDDKDKTPIILITGLPNSGKSTLMNCLLNKNRSLVTHLAGTTQEPVIDNIRWQQSKFQLVDSAGIIKHKQVPNQLWLKCNIFLIVIDATLPITKELLQIANLSSYYKKPLIIVVNKIDIIDSSKPLIDELTRRLKSLRYCLVVKICALKCWGINNLIFSIKKVFSQMYKKFTNNLLNKEVKLLMVSKNFHGKKLKIYFVLQELKKLQNFIFFVNNPQLFHFSYRRYLSNQLRQRLGLENVPIELIFKKSS